MADFKMKQEIYVVIMAGGSGTRFWPYSRENKPKQFLDLLGTGRTLLQQTYDRFSSWVPDENFLVVTNHTYEKSVKSQLPGLLSDHILLEPLKRNTAPCIAYAVYKIRSKNPNALFIITPADHFIGENERFQSIVETAVKAASEDQVLITIGIEPHRPETGYGYIQFYESDTPVKKVKTFTEKPNLELAEKFIESGDFVWNAGIFVWSVSAIVEAFKLYQPELAETFAEGNSHYYSEKEKEFIENAYAISKSISIDYAIMEKASNVHVVLGNFGWSDLGSWDSLYEMRKKDENENVIEGSTLLYQSHGNFIRTNRKDKLIVTADLEGYLVADFDDVLLICKKDDAEKFKMFVNEVKANKGEKYI